MFLKREGVRVFAYLFIHVRKRNLHGIIIVKSQFNLDFQQQYANPQDMIDILFA